VSLVHGTGESRAGFIIIALGVAVTAMGVTAQLNWLRTSAFDVTEAHGSFRIQVFAQVGALFFMCAGLLAVVDAPEPMSYVLAGTVRGLNGQLQIINGQGANLTLNPAPNGSMFMFNSRLKSGSRYNVSWNTPPSVGTCTVTQGGVGFATRDVSNVIIQCTAGGFTVGGQITGLTTDGLRLENNRGDPLTVGRGTTAFTFAATLQNGAQYAVTVLQDPSGQRCTVSNGSGTINNADVRNVQVTCV
jgi:hypothetical protein